MIVAKVAEEYALEPDTTVEEAAGSWLEMGFAEHDLNMLWDTHSDTDQVAKAVLAGSIGIAYRLLE